MPVYSMTGYATVHGGASKTGAEAPAATPVGLPSVGLELRSVNSRFLDLSFKLSDELRNAEPALREKIMARVKRGKVELRAWIEGRADGGCRAGGDAGKPGHDGPPKRLTPPSRCTNLVRHSHRRHHPRLGFSGGATI